MNDLKVSTPALLNTALELTGVSEAAHALADSHVRAASLAPALGFDEPAQAVDSFLNTWAYGIRWIASHAEQLGRDLRLSADTFTLIEARLAQAAGGAVVEPVLSAPPATRVETPLPMVRHWTGVIAPPMQLAHATRADQIIPGDPEQVRIMYRLVAGFADAADEKRFRLSRSDLGGWTGAAARVVAIELDELKANVVQAQGAFEEAASALSAYAFALGDAQDEVKQAIVLWQSAIKASEVARGVAVGPAPVGAPDDPDAVLARAGAMTQDALTRIHLAGKTLATVLHEQKERAPKDPGFWAHVRRAVSSFGMGLVEGSVVGPIEGAIVITKLVVALNPVRAIYDPQGYADAQEALYIGLGHALANPDKVAASMLNVKELRENPAGWTGEFLPDLLAIGAAGRGLALAKRAESLEQVTTAGEAVTAAIRPGEAFNFPQISRAVADKTITDLHIDPQSVVGRAVRSQLAGPYGGVDRWEASHLAHGTRVAVLDGGRTLVPLPPYGDLPMNGSKFFEDLQMYGKRTVMGDGTPGPPYVTGTIKIFEVRAPGGVDAARAIAEANTQFGAGGGTRLFVPDVNRAMADGRLVEVGHHHFDPMTLRSKFEDPAYRAVNPDLPIRALDPRQQQLVGLREGLQEKGLETVRDKAQSAVLASAATSVDGGEK